MSSSIGLYDKFTYGEGGLTSECAARMASAVGVATVRNFNHGPSNLDVSDAEAPNAESTGVIRRVAAKVGALLHRERPVEQVGATSMYDAAEFAASEAEGDRFIPGQHVGLETVQA